jgi:major capsid protein
MSQALKKASPVHFAVDGKDMRRITPEFAKDNLPEVMKKLGFGAELGVLREMARMYAGDSVGMDSLQGLISAPSVPGLIQFLQFWMPGQVWVMTADRAADRLMGLMTQGEFRDEQIVQEFLEISGYPRPYADDSNIPLADYNVNYPYRTVVRLELGMRVGVLEEERSAAIRVNATQSKREACGENLEVSRNLISFFGYNSGANNTYGMLNDPGLLPVNNLPNGAAGSTLWSKKTYLEITHDLLLMMNQLLTQTKDKVDPMQVDTVLALPQNAVTYMATTTDFGGTSVRKWLADTYPKCRVDNAVQLNTAGGNVAGDGQAYLYAERIQDRSTDDGRVWANVCPQRFRVLGVQKLVKGWEEGYAMATAGVMLKRPTAVTIWQGLS